MVITARTRTLPDSRPMPASYPEADRTPTPVRARGGPGGRLAQQLRRAITASLTRRPRRGVAGAVRHGFFAASAASLRTLSSVFWM